MCLRASYSSKLWRMPIPQILDSCASTSIPCLPDNPQRLLQRIATAIAETLPEVLKEAPKWRRIQVSYHAHVSSRLTQAPAPMPILTL